ncbi:MAG: rod shape-determining protein MreC [Eubacteriales bacterium]|nr:rod shape-determining protein MreC [Eubacteriales bacterium]
MKIKSDAKKNFTTAAVLILVMVVAIGLFVRPGSKLDWLGNIVSVPFSPFQKLFSSIGNKIEKSITVFSEAGRLRDENAKLQEEAAAAAEAVREAAMLRLQNEELKRIINYKDNFNDYEIMNAGVIAKDAGNLFNIFVIDRGISDGIKTGRKGLYSAYYPVVADKGLVGRVISSYALSSKVLSIIDEGSAVSALVVKNRTFVEVKGDITLKDKGLCLVDNIGLGEEAGIAPGDLLETSGLGGIYPKGIIIGRIIETGRNEETAKIYAILEPAVDFARLETVYVMKSRIDNDGLDETGRDENR